MPTCPQPSSDRVARPLRPCSSADRAGRAIWPGGVVDCEPWFAGHGRRGGSGERHDVAMQVAAADPQFIRREDVTAQALDKERDIQRGRSLQEGKPEKMVDKIVEGRMNKFYEEVCLYDQPFIRENSSTVADVIKAVIAKVGENISVARFVRFKVGEVALIESTEEQSAPE